MDDPPITCADPARLGRSLRNWRVLNRVKQAHAADLLGISQATLSRWENGGYVAEADRQARLRSLLAARPTSAADHALCRLVVAAPTPMHLVCDMTHRLFAASRRRAREFRAPLSQLIGTSLWRHASEDIMQLEAGLGDLGWFDTVALDVTATTRPNSSATVIIPESRFRWVRFQLSCGSFARLVETLSPLRLSP